MPEQQDQLNTIHDAMLSRDGETMRFRWGRSVGSVGVTVTSYAAGRYPGDPEPRKLLSEKTISLDGARGLWRTLISTGWSRPA